MLVIFAIYFLDLRKFESVDKFLHFAPSSRIHHLKFGKFENAGNKFSKTYNFLRGSLRNIVFLIFFTKNNNNNNKKNTTAKNSESPLECTMYVKKIDVSIFRLDKRNFHFFLKKASIINTSNKQLRDSVQQPPETLEASSVSFLVR